MSDVIFDKLISASTGKSVNVEDIIDGIKVRVIDAASGLPVALEEKVDKVEDHSLIADSEILRLLDIESEATKNSTDEELRDRTTHTGEQPIATITGLGPALSGKVDKIEGRGLVDNADISKLTTVETGATKNRTDEYLLNRVNHTGEHPISSVSGLGNALNLKVDKETGKSLVVNEQIVKLAGVEAGATKNQTDAHLVARANHTGKQPIATVDGLQTALVSKVDKVLGKSLIDDSDIQKLAGIQNQATKNQTDAQLRDRATHTGLQSTDTIDGLDVILSNKVNTEIGKSLTPTSEITKLLTVQPHATKNRTDAHLLSRANHTGTQALSTVDGLVEALGAAATVDSLGNSAALDVGTGPGTVAAGDDQRIVNAAQRSELAAEVNALTANKVDKVPGKGLSDNNFSDSLRVKLEMLEGHKFKGTYLSLEELERTALLTEPGAYADVDGGPDAEVMRYIWDSTDNAWVAQESAANLTAEQVKRLFEENPDTNVLTDEEQSKLAGIEYDATKNETDAQLRDRTTHTGMQPTSTITGLDAAILSKVDKVEGKSLVSDTEITRLSNMATGATKNATDAQLRDRTTHTGMQPTSTITGLDAAILSKVDKVEGKGLSDNNFDDPAKAKLADIAYDATKNETDAQLRDRTTHTGMQPTSTITGLDTALSNRVKVELGKSLILDTEINRLAGMATGATKNATDAQLRARASHTGEQPISTISGLALELSEKVVKETGKGLSSEDFTLTHKDKVESVETGATKNKTDAFLVARVNHTGTQPISTVSGLQTELNSKVDKEDGKSLLSNDEISKLLTVTQGATKNATDAQLRDRTTHTGMQPTSSITGLDAAILSKVDKVTGHSLLSDAEITRLGNIATGATKNATDAQLRDRTTHTGMQPTSTITGLDAAILSKVDKVAGKGLSSQDYTLAEKQKLASLESSKYRGVYQSLSALVASVTTATAGDYADVDAGVGHDALRYIYDGSDDAWIPQESNPTVTAAQIKDYYESNEDTNAYTDAEKTKLGGVADGATKNSTDAQLRARSSHTGTQAISTIAGLQAGLDAKVDAISGKGLSTEDYSTTDKTKLSGVAVGATKNATDAYLLNRVNHTGTQPTSTITGLDAELLTKVVKEAGKGLSTNDYTTAEKNKLGTIAESATKNATDAALRARSSHTGTQATSTIDGLDTALNNKVDKVAGKGLSSADFTLAEKNKLAGLESSKFRGSFISLAALQAGATSPTAGDYADVDAGAGSDSTRYIYDVTDARWVDIGNAPPLTAAQVKTLYESNADTNVLTDARRNIVDGATNAANLTSGIIPTARLPAAALIGDTKYTGTSGVTVAGTVISADATVVRTSGAQTITGVKTHNDNVIMNDGGTQYKSGAEGCTVVYNATTKALDFNFF